jgi:hypothetical protein
MQKDDDEIPPDEILIVIYYQCSFLNDRYLFESSKSGKNDSKMLIESSYNCGNELLLNEEISYEDDNYEPYITGSQIKDIVFETTPADVKELNNIVEDWKNHILLRVYFKLDFDAKQPKSKHSIWRKIAKPVTPEERFSSGRSYSFIIFPIENKSTYNSSIGGTKTANAKDIINKTKNIFISVQANNMYNNCPLSPYLNNLTFKGNYVEKKIALEYCIELATKGIEESEEFVKSPNVQMATYL